MSISKTLVICLCSRSPARSKFVQTNVKFQILVLVFPSPRFHLLISPHHHQLGARHTHTRGTDTPTHYTCSASTHVSPPLPSSPPDIPLALHLHRCSLPHQPSIKLSRPMNIAIPRSTLSPGTEDPTLWIRVRSWRITYRRGTRGFSSFLEDVA